MDISATLKNAWDAVQAADLPDQIQSAAFTEAVRMLSMPTGTSGGTAQQTAHPAPSREAPSSGAAESEALDELDLLTRVQTGTGVSPDGLRQLIHVDGDTVKISVAASALGKTSSSQTRGLARLITVTRGFGIPESDTSLELIRAEASRLRCYDGPNFSRHIGGIQGYVVVGSGKSKRLRAKPAGVTAFPALVAELVEGP